MVRCKILSGRTLNRACLCVCFLSVLLFVHQQLRTADSGSDVSINKPPRTLKSSSTTTTPSTITNLHSNCSCTFRGAQNRDLFNSTCSGFRASRLNNQDVVSMSFFGDFKSRYLAGVEKNAEAVRRYYPGWLMRVYVDGRKWREDDDLAGFGCQMMCRFDFLDFCDVADVAGYGDLSRYSGSVWRFLPLGDSSVRRFIVRDLDAQIIQRDRDVVDDWISSGLSFHVIRDHPFHGAVILGGLWGAVNINKFLFKRIA